MGPCSTLFSEGIVGYYYSSKDTMEWKKNNILVSQHPDFAMKDFILNSNFDFSPLSYAASAHLAVYLINTYGLDKYKKMSKYNDAKKGSEDTYNQTLDSLANGWNQFFQKNKYKLGPETRNNNKGNPNNYT